MLHNIPIRLPAATAFLAVFAMFSLSARAADFSQVCKTGTVEQVTAMVKAGADVNAMDKDGATPLMRAAGSNANADVIAVLVKAGANVNAKDNYGDTPLMWAARRGSDPARNGTLSGPTAATKPASSPAIVAFLLKAGIAAKQISPATAP